MIKLRLNRHKKLCFFIICLSIIIFCASLYVILNLPVTSKQGVNYVVKTIRMPLYIKIIEFLDRDYQYRKLTKSICQEYDSDKEKVLAIFEWTHGNIKSEIPEGWPIIDDHVWHIIVRGYGTNDQSSDVFSTLCNYAGIDAFFSWVYTQDRTHRIPLSYVRIEGKWTVFDPYNGVYFENKSGRLADINELKKGNWQLKHIGTLKKEIINYKRYFDNLPDNIEEIGFKRSQIQSPFSRLLYEVKKWLD